jgi:hypothetical protein
LILNGGDPVKVILGFILGVIMIHAISPGQNALDLSARFKAVPAFEVQPGILAFPKFSSGGQVCELALQRQHYTGQTALLDAAIPHEVIGRVVDQIVSPRERGTLIPALGQESISAYSGNAVTTTTEYENVSIQVFGRNSPKVVAGDVVVVIHWKKRTCQ